MKSGASFGEAVRVALASLRSSKLRSFLTLLGIILATTTLIAVVSVINGMDLYIANAVSNMGSEGFRVVRLAMIGNFDAKKMLEMQRRNPQLTVEEYDFIRSRVTLVREIGIVANRGGSVRYGSNLAEGVQIQGVTSNVGAITNVQTAMGRFLTDTEDQRRVDVAFLGSDLAERFFTGVDPIGKTIAIEGRPFRVVGVSKPLGSLFGQSRDAFVWIPVRTYFKMYGARRGFSIVAQAVDQARFTQAQDEVRMLLRSFRGLKPKEEDNFGIFGSDSLIDLWNQLTRVIAATAIAVVSVFMVVGGVVIMNIMLAVVTERTHEIGIRKSVGARQSDILNQFLVESLVLSAAGGVVGVLAAWGVAVAVRNLTPVPMSMPYNAVLIGVGLSAAVGLFFGIYPARRAAQLDPIVALRYEK
ncbi:MAG TPA: ABC transporter permease [Bryobacteraceae bacterium]|nr:ABC transporter permease [Bryobacteraceae bacterium]